MPSLLALSQGKAALEARDLEGIRYALKYMKSLHILIRKDMSTYRGSLPKRTDYFEAHLGFFKDDRDRLFCSKYIILGYL